MWACPWTSSARSTRQELYTTEDSAMALGRCRWVWPPSHPAVFSPGEAFFSPRGLCFGYKKDLGSNANWYQLLGPRSRWGTLSAHVPPQLSPRGAPASPAPLAADCLSKQPPEVPDSVILAHCQWSCSEDSGPVAWYLPVWSDCSASSGKQEGDTPIMPLLSDPIQTPAS